MRKIEKKEAPAFYTKYLTKNKHKTWKDIDPIRKELRNHILGEQKNCCAYTETRISNLDNCHIDHFKTRNLFPEYTFDYSNLLVSCNNENYGAKHKDKLVKEKDDYKNLINPAEECADAYIEYTITGSVEAINKNQRGIQTINYFNLNERSLLERRRLHALNFSNFSTCLDEGLSIDEIVKNIGEFETLTRQLYNEPNK